MEKKMFLTANHKIFILNYSSCKNVSWQHISFVSLHGSKDSSVAWLVHHLLYLKNKWMDCNEIGADVHGL